MATVEYGQSKTLKVTMSNPNPRALEVGLRLSYTTPLGVTGSQSMSIPTIPANGSASATPQSVTFSIEGTWKFELVVTYDGKTFSAPVESVSTWTIQAPGVTVTW